MFELWIYIVLGLIVFCTFTLEGIAGFGSTVLALPFAAMLIGLDKAVPLLSSLNILLASFIVMRSWRYWQCKEYVFITANAALGVMVGLFMLNMLPQKVMLGILMCFMFMVGIRGIIRQFSAAAEPKKASKNILSCLLLFAGGIFQGAFSSGGPLVVIYAAEALPQKSEFRATLSSLWLTVNLIMNSIFICSGKVWSKELLWAFIAALPFIAGGMTFGDFLHRKVDQKKFTLLVYSILTSAAFVLLGNLLFK